MAHQLGGEDAFKILLKNDEAKSSPGKDTLHKLFDSIGKPCLILMDEIVTYLVSLAGVDRHLYAETIQFLQQLIEVVAKRDGCAYVFTLPNSFIECINADGENAQKILAKAAKKLEKQQNDDALAKTKKVSERGRTAIQPVEYIEIFDIIRKRLFNKVDPKKAALIGSNIEELWLKYVDWKDRFLPADVFKTAGKDLSFKEKMVISYPFHPALIDVFYNEWGAHARFQRTRAILRIFAKIIYHFAKADKDPAFINCGDIPFESDADICTELLTYMGPNFESVINIDIERCKVLEAKYAGEYSKGQIFTRLFRSTFLHSLPVAGRSIGATANTLILDSVHYNMIPATFKDALTEMSENLFHFFQEGRKYTISFAINLNAMIVDETEFIKADEIEIFLKKNLGQISPKTHPIINWPEDSKEIPEILPKSTLPSLIFVACSLEYPTMKMSLDPSTEKKLQVWATMRGSSPRVYKNGLFFILMNRGLVSELENNVRRYLGMLRIIEKIEDKDSSFTITDEQIVDLFSQVNNLYPDKKIASKLKKHNSKAKLTNVERGKIIIQLQESYSHIAHWNGKSFEQKEISSEKFELVSRALDTLLDKGWLLDKIAPGYISREIGEIISTESFWKNFFQFSGVTLPLNISSIQDSLSKAIEQGKLALAVSPKLVPDEKTHKPDDFPQWVYGTKIQPSELKINSLTYLIPSKIADLIVSNGKTSPNQPELDDIGKLNPHISKVHLNWGAIPKSSSYKLFRDSKSYQKIEHLKPIYEGKSTSFEDTLTTAGTYFYSVVASNEYGDSKHSCLKSVEYRKDYPPIKPVLKEIATKPIKKPEIYIEWGESIGSETYQLLKSKEVITSINECETVYEGTSLNYSCSLVDVGTYYFAVVGKNQFGNSEFSDTRGVTFGIKQPPIAPILSVSLMNDGDTVECSWKKVSNAKKFKLYRAESKFNSISSQLTCLIDADVLTFRDQPGIGTFYYSVRAENDDGESVFSNCESITIGKGDNPIKIELNVKPDYLDEFVENFGEFISNLISIGADPSVDILINAKIPSKLSKVAEKTLKTNLIKKNSYTSETSIKWDEN